MHKDTSYKAKIAILAPWLPSIVDTIKKDLKQEHLSKDWNFAKQYFPGKNPSKLTAEELSQGYAEAIASGETGEELAEFVCNRWLLKNADLYNHFEKELSRLFPNFAELEQIDESTSKKLMADAVSHFGAPSTYQFCVINSVVFPKSIFEELSKKAHDEAQKKAKEEIHQKELRSIEEFRLNYEQQISRLTDKYEKKIAGLEKKYHTDVEALKKQVATLQRKLSAG